MSKVKTETQNSPIQKSKAPLLPNGTKLLIDFNLRQTIIASKTDFLLCLT